MVKIELGAKDYLAQKIGQEFSPLIKEAASARKRRVVPGMASKRKFTKEAKVLLSVIADWLEQALMTFAKSTPFSPVT